MPPLKGTGSGEILDVGIKHLKSSDGNLPSVDEVTTLIIACFPKPLISSSLSQMLLEAAYATWVWKGILYCFSEVTENSTTFCHGDSP